MQLKFLRHKDINREKWDQCVKGSPGALIYGHAVFLDSMVRRWDAVVANDYEAVFPLPRRRKFGISYIYHPAFTQQLGLFSTNAMITTDSVLAFVKQHFKYADLFLNFTTKTQAPVTEKSNFVLDLSKPYKQLAAEYKADLKKNLAKAEKHELKFRNDLLIDKAITMYRDCYGHLMENVSTRDYENFRSLCKKLSRHKMVFTRYLTGPGEEIMAMALFLFDGKRIYNIMNSVTPAGKKIAANHSLLDNVVREFAGRNYIFDFEGSDTEGIKSFYLTFGAVNRPYFYHKYNHLPGLLKLLKK